MTPQIISVSELARHIVTHWQGTEMAFTEGASPSDIHWESDSIPYLQLIQLELLLADGRAFRLLSQLEDGSGFYGLYLAELATLPRLVAPTDPSSIYRDRALPELPTGQIMRIILQHDEKDALVEAKLDIGGSELRLVAGEIYEQFDSSLLVVTPDESILVQVNGARPRPSVKQT